MLNVQMHVNFNHEYSTSTFKNPDYLGTLEHVLEFEQNLLSDMKFNLGQLTDDCEFLPYVKLLEDEMIPHQYEAINEIKSMMLRLKNYIGSDHSPQKGMQMFDDWLYSKSP